MKNINMTYVHAVRIVASVLSLISIYRGEWAQFIFTQLVFFGTFMVTLIALERRFLEKKDEDAER